MELERALVKIGTMVPHEHADAVREALGSAGAGQLGEYSYCSFSVTGNGRFMPSESANPYIGTANKLEVVEEERIEVVCDRKVAKEVLRALRDAHPYEEVALDVVALIDEAEL